MVRVHERICQQDDIDVKWRRGPGAERVVDALDGSDEVAEPQRKFSTLALQF